MRLDVLPTATALAQAAADNFVSLAQKAIAAKGQFNVALTGGTTPGETYQLLASETFAAQIDWSRVHVFWCDERCVPPDHEASNYRMARAALLAHVPIPAINVHRMRGEDQPAAAASDYERVIADVVGEHFDLIHLGMGADAHIASLFPDTPALHEQSRRVQAQFVEAAGMWRITLTPVAILGAAYLTLMVTGESKAAALARVLEGGPAPDKYPAQIVAWSTGQVHWLVDSAAASQLEQV
jgi:6-phosphogluconolactonase